MSKTGVVATFGGGNQPPVTLFMDGFVDGVAKYNEVHGTAVRALGWDKAKQDGAFTGDFEDINKGKALAEGFIDQGADVILPVAGQVGEGATSAALERGGVSVIWVDSDGYESLAPEFRPVLLTSVLKNTQDAMVEIVGEVQDGSFSNEPYIGTLENGGVEIAPYHDLAPLVHARARRRDRGAATGDHRRRARRWSRRARPEPTASPGRPPGGMCRGRACHGPHPCGVPRSGVDDAAHMSRMSRLDNHCMSPAAAA